MERFSLCPPGGGLTFKRGAFRSIGWPETTMSVCYGRTEALVFSGTATGDVYIWKEPLLLKTVKAHDGPVFAMFSLDKVRRAGPNPTHAICLYMYKVFESSHI